MSTRPPLLSVIVPAHQAAKVLPRSLGALADSDLPRACWELIVVDDASTDGTDQIAASWADVVVRLPGAPHGPSYARNRGSEVARGEILVFIDADVCVHGDALRRFAWAFLDQPDVSAVFGAYDASPDAPGLVSQYRNLLHHYVHMRDRGEAVTFWAGCGAIRAAAFAAAGSYNEWHFSRPQIEDIELGGRLRDLGHRIVLRPEIQGTHLKRWRLRDVVRTDLNDRGVPWTRLLIQRGEVRVARSLNLRGSEKACTVLAGLGLVAIAAGVVLSPWWLLALPAALGPVLWMNRDLYAFFRRHRGLWFALRVLPLHLLYYVLNGVSVVSGWVLHHTVGEPQPPPNVQAFAEVGLKHWPPVPRRASLAPTPVAPPGTPGHIGGGRSPGPATEPR